MSVEAREIEERRRNERSLALLAEASAIFAQSLDWDKTLENVVRLALPRLGDFGFFDVVEQDGSVRRIARAHQDEAKQALLESTSWVRSERTDLNLCALSSGRSGFHPYIDRPWLENIAASPEHLELMLRLDFHSMITVPLRYQGRVLGALTLFFNTSSAHHTTHDLALAEDLASRGAAAVQNAHLYRELLQANVRWKEADRKKDTFIAMLGHELRNPLSPIITALRVIEMKDKNAFPRELAIIRRQSEHLVRLVDDMLDVSRIIRGKVELRKRPLELKEIVERAAELASPLMEQAGHRVDLDVPAQGLLLFGDDTRLTQVVTNLLSNAARYTPPGGNIQVTASRAGEQIELVVTDSGIGLEPHVLQDIFEPFVQGDRALARTEGGLGLGLAIVKGIVELHGGSVRAESKGRGSGSTFIVRLPLGSADVNRTVANERIREAARARRVLIVDDNRDAADLLSELFALHGHEVRTAHDGPEALAAIETFEPELALLDIGLPVIDGYELARRIRGRFGGRTRLVAVTGYGQTDDRERTREAGFEEHFVKPLGPADIHRLLGGLA